MPSRGPGTWKFNNSLLNEQEFVYEMEKQIPEWIVEAEQDLPNNIGSQWSFLKFKIGEFSRKYGAQLKKARHLLKENICKEMEVISGSLDSESKGRYESLQSKLNEIIDHEIKGSILRSLCQDYMEGEKCTRYFFSLEKAKIAQKTITSL